MTASRIRLEECSHEIRCALGAQPVRIWSREHGAYWRYPAAGYTTLVEEAGVYSLGEAWRRTRHCGPEKGVEFVTISEKAVAFITANQESPVIAGHVISHKDGGGQYTLADDRVFRLTRDECREVGNVRWIEFT